MWKGKGLDLGVEPPRIIRCWVPHPSGFALLWRKRKLGVQACFERVSAEYSFGHLHASGHLGLGNPTENWVGARKVAKTSRSSVFESQHGASTQTREQISRSPDKKEAPLKARKKDRFCLWIWNLFCDEYARFILSRFRTRQFLITENNRKGIYRATDKMVIACRSSGLILKRPIPCDRPLKIQPKKISL